MLITCACGHEYTVSTIPCPDGIQGCLTAHWPEPEAYDCTRCGKRNAPNLAQGVTMEIGKATMNIASIKRLDLYRENDDG